MDEAGLVIEMEDSFQCWITDETGQRELVFEVSKPTWNDDEKRRAFLVQRIADEALELVNLLKHG
jgi:hypothetical protein